MFPCKVFISIFHNSHSTLIAILFKYMSIFIQIIYDSIFKLPHQCHLHLNHPFQFFSCFWEHIFASIQINFPNQEENRSGDGRDTTISYLWMGSNQLVYPSHLERKYVSFHLNNPLILRVYVVSSLLLTIFKSNCYYSATQCSYVNMLLQSGLSKSRIRQWFSHITLTGNGHHVSC